MASRFIHFGTKYGHHLKISSHENRPVINLLGPIIAVTGVCGGILVQGIY
jgi:hypothetical protein